MSSFCLSLPSTSKIPVVWSSSLAAACDSPSSSPSCSTAGRSVSVISCWRSLVFSPISINHRRRAWKQRQVVCMAPEEEKLTRRNPLDFPIEWERPKPGRRPDIFPQFSPMKTPLPPPLPCDPPEEDEEEEEKKEEEEEETEEEESEKPEKQP